MEKDMKSLTLKAQQYKSFEHETAKYSRYFSTKMRNFYETEKRIKDYWA